MWKDFKEFAFKGNVLDLAIAVVIGTAFGKIVSSLVDEHYYADHRGYHRKDRRI